MVKYNISMKYNFTVTSKTNYETKLFLFLLVWSVVKQLKQVKLSIITIFFRIKQRKTFQLSGLTRQIYAKIK